MNQPRLIQVEGKVVEEDALRIAERVNDYDPNLRVQVLEGSGRLDQPPFQVVEHCKDGVDRVVLTAWQLDGRILERIMAADTQVRDIDAFLTQTNVAAKEASNRRYKEEVQEASEVAHAILRSPKDTYTAPNADGKIRKFRA